MAPTRPAPKPVKPVPSIKDVIGKSLPHIGTYVQLDNKKQVVALIDDVRFRINSQLKNDSTISKFKLLHPSNEKNYRIYKEFLNLRC